MGCPVGRASRQLPAGGSSLWGSELLWPGVKWATLVSTPQRGCSRPLFIYSFPPWPLPEHPVCAQGPGNTAVEQMTLTSSTLQRGQGRWGHGSRVVTRADV